jgi:hypothetical protein
MILSTLGGWISLMITGVLNYFAGYEFSVRLVVLLASLDLAWSIASNIKRGTFALSELARDSVSKLSVYGCVMIVFVGIDKLCVHDGGITTIVVCSLISLVEAWSMAGHMLVMFPNMPFLRLLKPILIGEIANKLKMSVEDARRYMEGVNDGDNSRENS